MAATSPKPSKTTPPASEEEAGPAGAKSASRKRALPVQPDLGSPEPPAWTSRVLLRPLCEDGRKPVLLQVGASAEGVDEGVVLLGRSSRDKPNEYGIQDPRISRKHLRIEFARLRPDGGGGGVSLPVCKVTALGANPIRIVRGASFELVLQGNVGDVFDGDEVQLVDEEKCPAHESSLKWAGNPCAYAVQALIELPELARSPNGRARAGPSAAVGPSEPAPAVDSRPPAKAQRTAQPDAQPARPAARAPPPAGVEVIELD